MYFLVVFNEIKKTFHKLIFQKIYYYDIQNYKIIKLI